MQISLEKIDLLKERAQVGYKEAKEALERCDGDLVEALIWLEEKNKIHEPKQQEKVKYERKDYGRAIEDGVKQLHNTRFTISRENDTLLSLPGTVAILFGIFTLPFSVFAIILAILCRYQIRIVKPENVQKEDVQMSGAQNTDPVDSSPTQV